MLPCLIDRLGDAKDQVRDQDQSLLLKIMDQAASPQVSSSHTVEIKQLTHIVLLCVVAVFVGQNVGKLQAQEQQDQRRTVPLSHRHSEHVSPTSGSDVMMKNLALSFVPDDGYFICPLKIVCLSDPLPVLLLPGMELKA